ncbi:MAG: hypothetical protein U0350_17060 [Caldilineaceae bacterium]
MNVRGQKGARCVRPWLQLWACWLSLGLSGLLPTQLTLAAPLQRPNSVSSNVLTGQLPQQYSAHYLALETSERDANITLTLSYDPQDNPNLRGFVNFLVLTEDGLRQYLAGGDLKTLNIASGSPVQFDPIGNKMQAAFRDSGRGKYTVVVFNNAASPIQYTLSAQGGLLTDASGQTSPPIATPAPTTEPVAVQNAIPTPAPANLPTNAIRARKVTGPLVSKPDRRYLQMETGLRDGLVALRLAYDPQDQRALTGNVNFWVLDEDGLRRMINGEKAVDLNLATGFPVPFSPRLNEVQASFTASGHGPYTVVVYNNAPVSATYALAIDGGLLIDQYGQTNEAKAAAVEMAALAGKKAPTTSAIAPQAPTNSITTTNAVAASTPTTSTVFGVDKLAGALTQAYQNRYIGLTPELLDGTIGLTLAFDPKDNQVVRENVNFWVLTEDGLRRVINGARPEDLAIAMGMPVQYDGDQDKLSAVFNASGHGKYTVIVFNNSNVPVHYLLSAKGGLLADETGVVTSLP